ncbi:serine/threonine-protein kinase [Nannocystis sp.]|uniref:serine/threonine-protein kinase n=1 Tax=Nannocystis sp. TaxID=1962667 RepID=UPI0025D77A2F|nr:serine/threonine-protein kinase [Nannocystis sp.]MBK7827219.1 serine/threonine protein kinase [Nannocystis sp.]
MSRSGAVHSPVELVTVGDFDPQSDRAIEYDFIGRKIAGRYTVRSQIGRGGMADVFQATDEDLGVDVAIKLLKPRMASDDLRARMVQEARAAAQVRHPNLVRVFGTGSLDGTAFIVMELLVGPNLDQYLRARPDQRLPCDEALSLLLPALEALHAVHERGYVHRDIKPGNMLVTSEPGRPPTAVVIDLGLVKADRALRTIDSPPTTDVNRMLCTPGYISPEQALGRAVDRRSDVYSMGITLYRVLTGRLPFHEAHGKHIAAMLARHVHYEPTLIAEAGGTADIPPAVAAVVESALRKDPAARPQTMLEFAEALRAAAGAAPLPVAALPVAVPRPRVSQVNWVLLAFGLGIAVAWLFTPRTDCPRVPGSHSDVHVATLPLTATASLETPATSMEPPSRTHKYRRLPRYQWPLCPVKLSAPPVSPNHVAQRVRRPANVLYAGL